MKEKNRKIILSLIALGVCAILVLTGCASGHQKGDTYKIMLGQKCTKDGNISSRFWLHTTMGPDQIKKEWCK